MLYCGMKFTMPSFRNLLYERDKEGNHWYYLNQESQWGMSGNNLKVAQIHPILTPGILFVAKLFSQAKFKVVNKRTDKEIKSHWLTELLEMPNDYQTGMDFQESLMFMMIAQGKAVVWTKKLIGIDEPEELILLRDDLIEYPDGFNKKTRYSKSWKNVEIIYDKDGENIRIKMKHLLFFYDLPNMLNNNKFETKSRLDGLHQTLVNTVDSLLAKNIILKTNGKELITGKKGSLPLSKGEKRKAETLFNVNYGLGRNRKRGLLTRADLTWKSLHIALRDLGLDESVKVDGNLIYTALHIPKDIMSLEAKKTTYNNFKESMVSYIQNEQQPSLDAETAVFKKLLKKNEKLVGSFEHLPIMQFILLERYEGVKKQADALTALLKTGVPEELALEMCGFPKGTILVEIKSKENAKSTKKKKGKKQAFRRLQISQG